MAGKKPLVVVTRKLPDVIETRMGELFDVRLNSTDRPMTNAVGVVRRLARDMLCDLARTGRWNGARLVEPPAASPSI